MMLLHMILLHGEKHVPLMAIPLPLSVQWWHSMKRHLDAFWVYEMKVYAIYNSFSVCGYPVNVELPDFL